MDKNMAKEIDKKKKLKELEEKRNSKLVLGGISSYSGYKGYKAGETLSMLQQLSKVRGRINEIYDKSNRGEKISESEARYPQNPKDADEKILGAIYQSPRTKKGRIIGAAIGSIPSVAFLASAAKDQYKINKLKKQIKKEKDKKFSIMDKMFSKKNLEKSKIPTEEELSKLSRHQILRLLDKKSEQVEKDKKDYIEKRSKKGGVYGSIIGGILGASAGAGVSKISGGSTKSILSNALLSGGLGALAGHEHGKKSAKESARDYVKNADEFNESKVTRKFAKDLDKSMRNIGKLDDLEAINEERLANKKSAKSKYDNYLKKNSVLNLGRGKGSNY